MARRIGFLLATAVTVEILASILYSIVSGLTTALLTGIPFFELYGAIVPFFAFGFRHIWIFELFADGSYLAVQPWGVESVLGSYVLAIAATYLLIRFARGRWPDGGEPAS